MEDLTAGGDDGWADVLASSAAKAGGLPRRASVDGLEVVVWRRPDGRLAALDDRCAHQWVRLSAGTVRDDGCIVCPSHGWIFDADGWSQPVGAGRVRPWEVREVHDRIQVRCPW